MEQSPGGGEGKKSEFSESIKGAIHKLINENKNL